MRGFAFLLTRHIILEGGFCHYVGSGSHSLKDIYLEIASTVRVAVEKQIELSARFVFIYTAYMNIQKKVSLKNLNTLGVESQADFFVCVESLGDLRQAIEFSKKKDLEILILGGGSNICFLEKQIKKLVIKINIKGFQKQKDVLIVGAGESWDSFVELAITEGVPFIENLSGIPGTVGASPIQNIGAYGVEVKDFIKWVEVYDLENGSIKKINNIDCRFSYRHSIFKEKQGQSYIIIGVAFKVLESDQVCIEYKDLVAYFANTKPSKEQVRQAVLEIRSKKFPNLEECGTAGSFFKNPIISNKKYLSLQKMFPDLSAYDISGNRKKIPLAWILDKVCNLKGYKEGNVWLHDKQPLILVTNKQASAQDIKEFSKKIKKIVFNKTKINIENEVVFKK